MLCWFKTRCDGRTRFVLLAIADSWFSILRNEHDMEQHVGEGCPVTHSEPKSRRFGDGAMSPLSGLSFLTNLPPRADARGYIMSPLHG